MKKNELTQPQRQRTSVALQGLDLSSPDDIVKDGHCSILFNLRWKDNAWRPVHPHKTKGGYSPSDSLGTKKIVYKHPASADNKYIIEHYYIPTVGSKQIYRYAEVDITTNDEVDVATFNEQQRVSHFGNVLTFTNDRKNTYYRIENGKYGEVDINLELPQISVTHLDTSTNDPKKIYFKVDQQIHIGVNYPITPNIYHPVLRSNTNVFDMAVAAIREGGYPINISTAQQIHNVSQNVSPATYLNGLVWGNMCLFAAYRMSDGSVLQVSPLTLISRNDAYNIKQFIKGKIEVKDPFSNAFELFDDDFVWAESNNVLISDTENSDITIDDPRLNAILYSLPQVDVTVPNSVLDNTIVATIAVFATRVYHPFNKDIYEDIRGEVEPVALFNPIKIPDQPFYLVKEFTREDFIKEGGTIQILLTPSVLQKAINNLVYTPNNLSMVSGGALLDYNNRLHIANTTTHWDDNPHFKSPFVTDLSSERLFAAGIEIKHTDSATRLMGEFQRTSGEFKSPYDRILSYPDVSCTAFLTLSSQAANAYKYRAEISYANSFAYVIPSPNNEYQFPSLNFPDPMPVPLNSIVFGELSIHESNKIQVSASNNCFSFPFENTYTIGSSNNRIIALQSAAIEMSDAKFGEMPLYIFTTEGIFALQAGSETLYSNVIPINYDKIINPNTLAINGAIVYITEKGVHLLTNEGSAIISGPIHGRDGMPPLDFLRTCKIIHPKQYNEIVLHNEQDIKAYVYNIDSKYWSTRKLMGYKINTDELIDGNTILDLGDEDESKALSARILTRPIKLGNVEFKRLETIIPRMSTGDKNNMLQLNISGSLDGTTYETLRKYDAELEAEKVNPIVLRRTPFSAKYFSLLMNLTPVGETFSPSITHIDFEWYERFGRRMR